MDIFSLHRIVDYLVLNPWIIVLIFLIYGIIFCLTVVFGGKKPGKNPLANDGRRPREPLVTEQRVRDYLLKQRFKVTKIPDKLDAVIIGSGAGGLSAAVLLAKAGKQVLVLEQHDQAGGCCHTFKEKGFEFDTGIHYIGNMTPGNLLHDIVDQLTEGQLQWVPMDDAFDIVAIGPPDKAKLYPMKSGRDAYYNNLISMFPKEEAAINKYRAILRKIHKGSIAPAILKMFPEWLCRLAVKTGILNLFFGDFFKYANRTLGSVLDELTDNVELKAVLSYILGDYGMLPSKAPMALHGMLIDHYRKGAYYPDGGTSEIPLHMIHVIDRFGGRVLMNAPVSKILFNDKGRAIGVRVNSKVAGEVDIKAKRVISDAGAANTFKSLIPREIAQTSSYDSMTDRLGPGVSCITTFCGLSASPSELKMKGSNYWAYTSADIEGCVGKFMSMDVDDAVNSEVPLIYISFPSAKDPSWEERFPGKSVVLLITIAKWEWFSEWKDGRDRHRGDRYNELKNAIGRQMWKQAVSMFPQFDGQLEYMEVGTPVTNEFYLGAPHGELYGLDHSAERFSPETSIKLRPYTGIPGLYMTGQDTTTCGFVSAVLGGMLCAGAILNRNIIGDLEKLQKKMAKSSTKKVD